ncbi:uncharacterized protein YecE (DUF72 family) [Streptomyces sp. LBL]|nr:uncharacterized protein YecE (DUF72 family) [Streptomyces sp. LBL]
MANILVDSCSWTDRALVGSGWYPAGRGTPRHGRSAAWGTSSKEDRFRYDHSAAELAEWVPRLRAQAGQVDELHVLFNNCCADSAVRAAETMSRLLAEG